MKLQEVFDQLTHGEFSQLAIGGGPAGAITQANYPKVVSYVNLALLALYKRFRLKEGRLTINLKPGRLDYPLARKFALTSTMLPVDSRFIVDTADAKYVEDVLKIEQVLTPKGFEFSLNNRDDKYAMITPVSSTLRVPADIVVPPVELTDDMRTTQLIVVYRAAHPILSTEDVDPEDTVLELPYSHLEPLLYHVASRAHTPTGITNEMDMGNAYYQKYELACQSLEVQGYQIDQASEGTRLESKGFV